MSDNLGYWGNLASAWRQAKDPGPRITPMPTPQLDMSTPAGGELLAALFNKRLQPKQVVPASSPPQSEYSPTEAFTVSLGRSMAREGETASLAAQRMKLLMQALAGNRAGQSATQQQLSEGLNQRAEHDRLMLPLRRAHPKATGLGEIDFLGVSGGVPIRR